MAQNFTATIKPYIGTFYKVPVMICGQTANMVPLQLNWTTYLSPFATRMGVSVSLNNTQAGGTPIKRISSIYIDNTSSAVPIYVVFPTGFVVTAAPYTATYSPVIVQDGDFNLTIYGDGFVSGVSVLTRVFLLDVTVPGFVDPEIQAVRPLYLASPTITNGVSIFTTGFGLPALGDQIANSNIDMTQNPPVANTLFSSPISAGGYFYITSLNLTAFNVGSATDTPVRLRIQSTGASGNLFTWNFKSRNQASAAAALNLCIMSGMNLKIQANETWQFIFDGIVGGNLQSGNAQLNIAYTYNTL